MRSTDDSQVKRTVEAVARESYGRLIAFLSARTRDVASAEDALSDALIAALTTWTRDGIPDNPQAWLLTASRNRLADKARHAQVRAQSAPTLQLIADESTDIATPASIPDERLKLLFVCAHPAIDADIHTPLMLQAVLGLDAAAIGKAFLTAPTTMGQRLVRAKKKIRETGIAFEVPDINELPQRLEAVLNAIYAAYSNGWEDAGADSLSRGLTEEAIWLSRVLLECMPTSEARGLLALMLYCEARAAARRDAHGRFVPLSEQDTKLWRTEFIAEAERELAVEARENKIGRFQLEAAIQSVHAERMRTGFTNWHAIAVFYEQVIRLAPTLGARVAHAAAQAEVQGPVVGLELLTAIDSAAVVNYQPYWAVRAHLLKLLQRVDAATDAYDRAIELSDDAAVRDFLLGKRRELSR